MTFDILDRYPMDNSGILHMAVLGPGRSNIFRLEAVLTEPIRPDLLNRAFHRITPRFPCLVAGIRSGPLKHEVVPVTHLPEAEPDRQVMAPMNRAQLRRCAMRVLYRDHRIAVEFFHSLTDGFGGSVFLKALLAEYLRLRYGVALPESAGIPLPRQLPPAEESEDSFLTYAGAGGTPHTPVRAFQPCADSPRDGVHTVSGVFDVAPLLEAARCHGVSINTYLTAMLAESLMELQLSQKKPARRPVQIMVPANLRKRFPSRTLRNFSLYATVRMNAEQAAMSFEGLLRHIDSQLKNQLTREHFSKAMATNTIVDRNPLLHAVPLNLKCAAVRLGYQFVGECTTSLSMTNLGVIQFPEELRPYILGVNVLIGPRYLSAYNCSITSYNDRLSFNFVKTCAASELETIFFHKMTARGLVPRIFVDCTPVMV